MVKVGDGTHEHPTQALLDAATLRGRLGTIAGRRVGIVGDILHNRRASYNVFLLATLGAEAVLVARSTLLTDAFHRLPGTSQQRYPVPTLVITIDCSPFAVPRSRARTEQLRTIFGQAHQATCGLVKIRMPVMYRRRLAIRRYAQVR